MILKCSQCDQTVAKVTQGGLIRITRKSHIVLVHGESCRVVMSCPRCSYENIVEIKDRVLIKEGLKLEDEEKKEEPKEEKEEEKEPPKEEEIKIEEKEEKEIEVEEPPVEEEPAKEEEK